MNRTRMLALSVFALGLSAIVTVTVYRLLRDRLSMRDEYTQIVVSAEKLSIGTRLTPERLRAVSWPKAVPLEGSFKSVEEAAGRGVIVPMLPNEPVLESKLAPKEAGAGLSTVIPEGMRAVAVKVNDVVGVAGFVLPGTHVDVILSGSTDDNGRMYTSKVILENVQVLAAGQNLEQNADGKPQSVQVITLLVTPEDSQKLALGSVDGRIQLALRNPLDFEHAQPKPVHKTALYQGSSAPALPAVAVRTTKPKVEKPALPAPVEPPPPPPPPSPQTVYVDLIQGTSQKTLTFEVNTEVQ